MQKTEDKFMAKHKKYRVGIYVRLSKDDDSFYLNKDIT